MSDVVRTIGVDQASNRMLDVAVAEWDGDTPTWLLSGRIQGEQVRDSLLMIVQMFEVVRGAIDPYPDQRFAQEVVAIRPEVFALHSSGGHTAESLAEVAYRRMALGRVGNLTDYTDEPQIVSMEAGPGGRYRMVVVVPQSSDPPTHIEFALSDAVVLDRPDGTRVIEHMGLLDSVNFVTRPVQTPTP